MGYVYSPVGAVAGCGTLVRALGTVAGMLAGLDEVVQRLADLDEVVQRRAGTAGGTCSRSPCQYPGTLCSWASTSTAKGLQRWGAREQWVWWGKMMERWGGWAVNTVSPAG